MAKDVVQPKNNKFILDYFLRLQEHHQYMGYRSTGVDTKARVADRPTSNRLYVISNFSKEFIDPGTEKEKWPEIFTLTDLLKDHKRIFLLGDPGMGKTTLTDRLTYVLSDLSLRSSFAAYGELIPFNITLRELQYEGVRSWDDLLAAYFKQSKFSDFQDEIKKEENQKLIRQIFQSGQAFVLLDGLDEVNDEKLRAQLATIILDGMATYPLGYWWCTSRIVGFDQKKFWGTISWDTSALEFLEATSKFKESIELSKELKTITLGNFELQTLIQRSDILDLSEFVVPAKIDLSTSGKLFFEEFYLAPFSDEQIRQFIGLWFDIYEPRKHERSIRIEQFLGDLRENQSIMHLARIPNLLSMMAIYHDVNQRFPDGRVQLYETVVKLYLDKIFHQRHLQKIHRLEYREEAAILRDISLKMQQMRSVAGQNTEVHLVIKSDEAQLIAIERLENMRRDLSKSEIRELVSSYFLSLHRYSAILIPKTDEEYGFLHLSYQEYFAAGALQEKLQKVMGWGGNREQQDQLGKDLKDYAKNSIWHETMILFFESFNDYQSGGIDECNQTFKMIFDWEPSTGNIDLSCNLLAAKILANEYISKNFNQDERFRTLDFLWVHAQKIRRRSSLSDFLKAWGLKNAYYIVLEKDIPDKQSFRWVEAEAGFQAFEILEVWPKVVCLNLSKSLISSLDSLTNCHKLQWLSLSSTSIDNLKPLANLTNLNSLSLDQTQVQDIQPLANLTNLKSLSLDQTQVQDIQPLANLTNLNSLSLDQTQVQDIQPLTNLTKLNYLHLNQTQVQDIQPLANLTKLYWLDLNKTQIQDIRPLANLMNLSYLFLNQTLVQDIQPLANLTKLNWLYLNQAQVQDIQPLANLTNLQELDLNQAQVQDIQSLANLTKLHWLDLNQTQVKDIEPLANLTSLYWLYLNQTQVQDIQPLANLTNLTYLSLNQTQVQDIQPLANLTNLNRLDLNQTQIQDIQPLANLTNLNRLDLNQTQVQDIQPLANLTNLQIISLQETNIKLEHLINLQQINPKLEFKFYAAVSSPDLIIESCSRSIKILESAQRRSQDKEAFQSTFLKVFSEMVFAQITNRQLESAKQTVQKIQQFKPEANALVWKNVALTFLLNDEFEKAQDLYVSLKDQNPVSDYRTFKMLFLEDFSTLEQEGITHPDISKIKKLLEL